MITGEAVPGVVNHPNDRDLFMYDAVGGGQYLVMKRGVRELGSRSPYSLHRVRRELQFAAEGVSPGVVP